MEKKEVKEAPVVEPKKEITAEELEQAGGGLVANRQDRDASGN